jgi:DNA-binding response OmpR family regulator
LIRVVQRFRRLFPAKPILVLCSAIDYTQRVDFLQAGADCAFDCDEEPEVAAAHLHALLRRTKASALEARQAHGSFFREMAENSHFTRAELALLTAFEEKINQPVSAEMLVAKLGRKLSANSIRYVRVIMCHIRRKVPANIHFETVRGIGYSMHSSLAAFE